MSDLNIADCERIMRDVLDVSFRKQAEALTKKAAMCKRLAREAKTDEDAQWFIMMAAQARMDAAIMKGIIK